MEFNEQTMINQEGLSAYLQKSIPELSVMGEQQQGCNVYDVVKQLLQYTAAQIAIHNVKAARHGMAIAGQLYAKGNAVIRNAVENVFVFSFSSTFLCDENRKNEMADIVPTSLYELYKKQVINSHI